jgi:hypothetical protein
MEDLKISGASEWVVKVTDKDKINITCPHGFEEMVGKTIPVEALDLAVSSALFKEKVPNDIADNCICRGVWIF